MYTKVKSAAEIKAMRESGRQTALVLNALVAQIEVGMTTKDIADIARRELKSIKDGGKHAFFGYEGFPEVICVSVNEEVVHGIPGNRIIEDGDIVSVDYGVNYRGMITDAARSIIVGKGSAQDEKLVASTLEALDAGIFMARGGGCKVGDIAAGVQEVLDRAGFGIVRDLVGHGVGHQLHEEPDIPNYGKKGSGPTLETGMTIAIEPMSTIGSYRVRQESDGWTITTADRKRSAHFEDTILITDDGAEILTRI